MMITLALLALMMQEGPSFTSTMQHPGLSIGPGYGTISPIRIYGGKPARLLATWVEGSDTITIEDPAIKVVWAGADPPQTLVTAVDVAQLAALGVQVPPSTKSHIQVLVKMADVQTGVIMVAIRGSYEGAHFELWSEPIVVNEVGAVASFPFDKPYGVTVEEIRVVPFRAGETFVMKRGQTGLWEPKP